MSISKISAYICNWMDTIYHRDAEENQVIQYGLELFLDNILKLLLILIIGIMIGKGLETLIILFSFCGLRLQAGGKHAKTGIGCGLSMIMIWALSLFISYFISINSAALALIYVICSIIVIYCAPRSKNIEYFSLSDIHRKKLHSFVFLSSLIVFSAVFTNIREIIVYPVILEVLTLLPKNKITKENY